MQVMEAGKSGDAIESETVIKEGRRPRKPRAMQSLWQPVDSVVRDCDRWILSSRKRESGEWKRAGQSAPEQPMAARAFAEFRLSTTVVVRLRQAAIGSIIESVAKEDGKQATGRRAH